MSRTFVDHVVFAADGGSAPERPFAHALALSVVREATLSLVSLAGDPETGPPTVRPMLARWGLLEEGSPRSAVEKELSVRIRQVALPRRRAAARLPRFLRATGADLLVVAAEAPEAGRLRRRTLASRLPFPGPTPTLHVPEQGRGFVDPERGRLSLRRILLPVDHQPAAERALELAARAAEALGDPPVRIALLHVGECFPKVAAPRGADVAVETIPARGAPVPAITQAVRDFDPDLLVLPVGPRGALRALLRRGVAERVGRRAACPVLVVPVE